MSHASSTAETLPIVLHVFSEQPTRTGTCDLAAQIAARLEEEKRFNIDPCPDVYRALARLGRDPQERIRAVLVCADELTPLEREFFEIVRRRRRHVRLAVYGNVAVRVTSCTAPGANRLETPEALDDWLGSLASDHAAPHEATDSREESVAANPAAPTMSGDIDTPHETPHEPAVLVTTDPEPSDVSDERDDSLTEEDASGGRARVPWLHYQGGPERRAPAPPPDRDDEATGANTASLAPADEPYRPLLTDEELRALIGDDLGSLGPERSTRNADESEGERSSP